MLRRPHPSLEKLALPLARHCSRRAGPIHHERAVLPFTGSNGRTLQLELQKADSAPYLRGTVPEAWPGWLCYHPGPHPFPFITCFKDCKDWGMIIAGFPWLGATTGYLGVVSVGVQWWRCSRGQRPWTSKEWLQWTFMGGTDWTEGYTVWHITTPSANRMSGDVRNRKEDFCLFCF